ncbi:CsbD family protein, partial [Sphaerospermopsis reniformis]|uniref:CsbD family protein n=1 Tax=Sphaerospermopsis reniformis TaxID=531300 RepID=UPI001396854D
MYQKHQELNDYQIFVNLSYSGGRRQEAGGRRQKAEGRRHEAEGRRHEAEGRRQEAEGRRQKAEGRRQEKVNISCFPSHQSPVTSHQSPVTSHQSPVTSHRSVDRRDEKQNAEPSRRGRSRRYLETDQNDDEYDITQRRTLTISDQTSLVF